MMADGVEVIQPTHDLADKDLLATLGSQEFCRWSLMIVNPYIRLAIALTISYIVMMFIMLSRVNEFSNVFVSLNQVYMAGLMVAPMLLIMLLVMGSMYKNKSLNIVLLVVGTAAIGLFWTLVRTQAAVDNQQSCNR